jgi:signal transduction histidine kinase
MNVHEEIDRVTVVAHDLRAYLTPIYSRLQILSKRARHDGRELDVQLALGAERTIEQMTVLIDNLLDTARIDCGLFDLRLAPLDLAALVRETADLIYTVIKPIDVDLPDRMIVRGDRERLRQAVHNILANAARHSPREVPATARLVTELSGGDAWAVLAIRDHGEGIAPQTLPHIFEPFVAGANSSGLGLGLYLARHIVAAHGGRLTVRSTPGYGACFVLALPLLHEHMEEHTNGHTNRRRGVL